MADIRRAKVEARWAAHERMKNAEKEKLLTSLEFELLHENEYDLEKEKWTITLEDGVAFTKEEGLSLIRQFLRDENAKSKDETRLELDYTDDGDELCITVRFAK